MYQVLLASLLIAPNFYYTKIALLSFGPLTTITLRLSAATIFLLMCQFIFRKDKFNLSNKKIIYAAVTGLVGTVIPYSLHAYSMLHASTILAAILISLNPMFTFILSYFFISKQYFSKRNIIGICSGLLGLMVLLYPDAEYASVNFSPLYMATILCGTLFHSIGYICMKKFDLDKENAIDVTLVQVSSSLLYLPLITLLIEGVSIQSNFNLSSLMAVVALGVIVTSFGLMMYLRIMRTHGIIMVSLISYCRPVFASIIGILLLKEAISIHYLFASLLIMISLYFCKNKPNS